MPVVSSSRVTRILFFVAKDAEGRYVQSCTTRDRYQESFVIDDIRKWFECNLTHNEDNVDETDAATISVSFLLATRSEDRSTMREDAKLARFGDTWKDW